MTERRAAPRLPVRFSVALATPDEGSDGILLDVSASGAQVATEHPRLAPGTRIRARVMLRDSKPIELSGCVVWADAQRFAFEFTELDPAARKWLDALLGEEQTMLR